MKIRRAWLHLTVASVLLILVSTSIIAQVHSQVIQSPDLEAFLGKAKITRAKEISLGVTLPRKLNLELQGVQHSAAFKSIDEYAPLKKFADGVQEANFQDSYRTEIAAYEIDKIIGLGMVPTTVGRTFDGHPGSIQFWVDSEMDEGKRIEKKIEPPQPAAWNDQWQKVQLFDNLIYNVDRNRGNILITKDWEIVLIDHSRSFRVWDKLKEPASLTRFSKSLLEGLGRLNEKNLKERTDKVLSNDQRKGLLKRRDLILELAKKAVAERGEAAVLYP
jgi:hypothetical protein